MAILSLSGNNPVFNTWLSNRVNDLIITGAITFNNFDDISSCPQLFFAGRFYSFLNNHFINKYTLESKS